MKGNVRMNCQDLKLILYQRGKNVKESPHNPFNICLSRLTEEVTWCQWIAHLVRRLALAILLGETKWAELHLFLHPRFPPPQSVPPGRALNNHANLLLVTECWSNFTNKHESFDSHTSASVGERKEEKKRKSPACRWSYWLARNGKCKLSSVQMAQLAFY